MSKISLTPNASGTANFTIASPATNTDRTLTLPDNTGTILTSASNTNFPAGSVLQVVQSTSSSNTSTSSTSFVDTTVTLSITPSKSSNKILLIWAGNTYAYGGGADNAFNLRLVRNGTAVSGEAECYISASGTSTEMVTTHSNTVLDSPATTSAITYKIQVKASYGSNVIFNHTTSSITALEVSA